MVSVRSPAVPPTAPLVVCVAPAAPTGPAGRAVTRLPTYTCDRCGSTSPHPRDVAEQYCAACHLFADQIPYVNPEAPVPPAHGRRPAGGGKAEQYESD